MASRRDSPPRVRHADWICGHCGEFSPASFDACWNCGATRDGQADPDFKPEPEIPVTTALESASPQDAVRRLAVTTGIIGLALLMLRAVGPAAFVLTPLSYLYFVLFSPKDRPSGHMVVKIVLLLAVGSACAYVCAPTLFR